MKLTVAAPLCAVLAARASASNYEQAGKTNIRQNAADNNDNNDVVRTAEGRELWYGDSGGHAHHQSAGHGHDYNQGGGGWDHWGGPPPPTQQGGWGHHWEPADDSWHPPKPLPPHPYPHPTHHGDWSWGGGWDQTPPPYHPHPPRHKPGTDGEVQEEFVTEALEFGEKDVKIFESGPFKVLASCCGTFVPDNEGCVVEFPFPDGTVGIIAQIINGVVLQAVVTAGDDDLYLFGDSPLVSDLLGQGISIPLEAGTDATIPIFFSDRGPTTSNAAGGSAFYTSEGDYVSFDGESTVVTVQLDDSLDPFGKGDDVVNCVVSGVVHFVAASEKKHYW